MNYRHAFHAGNHADVLKHTVLTHCLLALARKAAAFEVLDTHAGRGLYDLSGPEAARSPEWREGVGRLLDWPEAPAALSPYLQAVRALNASGVLTRYPGSPLVAAEFLRPQDGLALCELHAEEAAALRRNAPPLARVHQRDGFAALGALLPPSAARRGLVLLDPPYEQPDELERSVEALREGVRRFRQGVFLWWRPLKDTRRIAAADAELAGATPGLERLRLDLRVRADGAGGLAASSVLALNPPFGLAEEMGRLLPTLSERLAQGAGADWLVELTPA